MIAAPYFIPPCVSVGPSSTQRTRFPLIRSAWSTRIGEAPSITIARGLSATMFALHLLDAAEIRRIDLVDDDRVRHEDVRAPG